MSAQHGGRTIAERVSQLFETHRRDDGRRYTTREVAAAVGCSHTHIAEIANGRVPDPHVNVLVGIANFFGKDPAYLIPSSKAGFRAQSEEVASIAFRASRLDADALRGVKALIDEILADTADGSDR
ncbi:helix-turn-helix domain-containing protein [Catellatospora paridis]|uniref:helix-turn-helix domain-containing protein n=1 Tax=Catellatospora paridis TaxID=1617086 RepID=UPI0018AF71FA|nr:helix-turn-helix domain-containing protein [Catellatospora paridis]